MRVDLVDETRAMKLRHRSLRQAASAPEIVGEEKPAPSADVWSKEIRPVLTSNSGTRFPHTIDVNLMIVDWNIAFDLVFSRLGATLRNKHVKHLIAELENFNEVMDQCPRVYSDRFLNGEFHSSTSEPLLYASEKVWRSKFFSK